MSKPFQLFLAPDRLWQTINPWNFYQQGAQVGLVDIELDRAAEMRQIKQAKQ